MLSSAPYFECEIESFDTPNAPLHAPSPDYHPADAEPAEIISGKRKWVRHRKHTYATEFWWDGFERIRSPIPQVCKLSYTVLTEFYSHRSKRSNCLILNHSNQHVAMNAAQQHNKALINSRKYG